MKMKFMKNNLMKSSFLIATFAYLSISTAIAAPVPNGPIGQAYNWSMIFEDDFIATNVDTTKWAPCINWGITTNGCFLNLSQSEWYLPANATVANGLLTLKAKQETISNSYGAFNYSSGFINSDRDTDTTATAPKFEFKYGYAEIRAKIPAGKGLWPAFWLLPSDHSTSSEIDVMEILGDHPEKNYMTYHYGNSQSVSASWSLTNTDFSKDYHTYAVDWSADAIVWYIDGIQVYQVTDKTILPNKPFYLIANLQVGGQWAGNPDASTIFPADYNIDYIRVWNKGSAITPPPTVSTNLLKNSSFEAGTSPWFLDVKSGAAASLSTDATLSGNGVYSALINTTQSSNTDWYVQFAQSNIATAKNKKYTVQFLAKAETPRTVAVILQKTNSPYTEYMHQSVNLTTDWAVYTQTFTASVTQTNNKLSFSLGANSGKVNIDQVVFGY